MKWLRLFDAVLDIVYPPSVHCLICNEAWPMENSSLCEKCNQSIEWLQSNICKNCGAPLKNVQRTYCEWCEEETHNYTQARSVTLYGQGVDALIWRFKYQAEATLAPIFGQWMNEVYNMEGWEVDIILSVPLHSNREKWRGYNQAQLLADEISKWQGIPTLKNVLVREKSTHTQTTLNRKERMKNLEDVFYVKRPKPVCDKKILLVDDVYTTGATVDQCCAALKVAGAKEVYVLTVAYTERDRKRGKHGKN